MLQKPFPAVTLLAMVSQTTGVDRLHNLTVNYSYVIPTAGHNAIVRAALGNWQVSGVTKLLSGTAVNPTCTNSTTRGVAYSTPSYTNTGAGATAS